MRSLTTAWRGIIILISISFYGCGALLDQTINPTNARLGEITSGSLELRSLPDPKEPIIVAVYKFRDQTGQYKPSTNGTSWSTAVTQGATTILVKALEDSKWFVPIERENVGNLLNERKIIRSSRTQYQGDGASALPPLLYAGVILEGGIISYDANVITGGAGLRYFGTGGSGQYRQDRVTVYLRAISTSNGKVLKTVYTSKTILSQSVEAGIFRFVKFGRLLEAETGFTYNEPSEIAVTEAIEKAVHSLIIEGVHDELWELKEARDEVSQSFLDYKKEKELIPQTDIFGKKKNNRRGSGGFGVNSASLLYQGDYPLPRLGNGFGFNFQYNTNPRFGLSTDFNISSFITEQFYSADVSSFDINAHYRLFPYDNVCPEFKIGIGAITENENGRFDLTGNYYPKFNIGGGIEYMLNDFIGLKGMADYNYIFSDNIDQVEQGRYNDFYWKMNIGLNFYFGKQLGDRKFDFIEK